MSELDAPDIGHGDLQEAILGDEFQLLIEQPELERAIVDALRFDFDRCAAAGFLRSRVGSGGIGTAGRTDDERGGQGDGDDSGD